MVYEAHVCIHGFFVLVNLVDKLYLDEISNTCPHASADVSKREWEENLDIKMFKKLYY